MDDITQSNGKPAAREITAPPSLEMGARMTGSTSSPLQKVPPAAGVIAASRNDGRAGERSKVDLALGIGADRSLGALAHALGLIQQLMDEDPATTAHMRWREEVGAGGLPQWRRLHEVGGLAICAVIHAEDPEFFRHGRSSSSQLPPHLGPAVASRPRVRGSNSLPQQLARNLFLHPTLTLRGKLVERLLGVALEHHLPKWRILELYLNVVEWGEDTWGIDAAAQHYFGHGCAVLTPFEAVFLATMLPAPRSELRGRNLLRIVHGQRRLTSLLYGAGVITWSDAAVTYRATARLEQWARSPARIGGVREIAASARYGKEDWLRPSEALRRECGVLARARFEREVRNDPVSALGITRWPEQWAATGGAEEAPLGLGGTGALPDAAILEYASPEGSRGHAARSAQAGDGRQMRWRVGLALHGGGGHFKSVEAVSAHLRDTLAHTWDLLEYGGLPYRYGPPDETALAVGATADVLVGYPSMLYPLLRARQEQSSFIPCVIVALGALPRGGIGLRSIAPYLRESDVFVVNSSADRELTLKMFPGAQVRVVPLAVRDMIRTEAPNLERSRIRAELGIELDSDVLLYAGRVSLEKNVHSILRLFAAVEPVLRRPTLLIAGAVVAAPFVEMGVHPVDYGRSLEMAREKLGLAPDRCRFLGDQRPNEVRRLMSAADVLVSLTLNHDENFGLAPVEGMACGTPTLGTAWGGLKDTIRDGLTGVQVPTVMTPAGVKLDWAAAIVGLRALLCADVGRLRVDADDALLRQYASSEVGEAMRCVVRETIERNGATEPLVPSAFAEEFWRTCVEDGAPHAMYRPGTRSFELYQELLGPYTSRGQCRTNGEPGVVILPAPVTVTGDGALRIDDPMFPFKVAVPEPLKEAVYDLVTEATLQAYVLPTSGGTASSQLRQQACAWAVSAGILLEIDSASVSALQGVRLEALTSPLFGFCDMGYAEADVLVSGGE